MRRLIISDPAVDVHQANLFQAIYLIVFADYLKKRLLHLSNKIVPDDDEPFAQQPVFRQHLEFKENGLWRMQRIGKYQVERISLHLRPAIGIPNVGREIIHLLALEGKFTQR